MNLLKLLHEVGNFIGLVGFVIVVSDKSDYFFKVEGTPGLVGLWPVWKLFDKNGKEVYTFRRLYEDGLSAELADNKWLQHQFREHNVDFKSEDWKISDTSKQNLKKSFASVQKSYLAVMEK